MEGVVSRTKAILGDIGEYVTGMQRNLGLVEFTAERMEIVFFFINSFLCMAKFILVLL